jgi:hypothetical protein
MTTTCSLHVIVVAPGSSYLPVDLVVPSNRTLTEIVREVLGQRGLDSAGIEWTVWYDEHVLDASFSLARAIPDLEMLFRSRNNTSSCAKMICRWNSSGGDAVRAR